VNTVQGLDNSGSHGSVSSSEAWSDIREQHPLPSWTTSSNPTSRGSGS
jgi:hypothetical protein